jgi:hypothetical protein
MARTWKLRTGLAALACFAMLGCEDDAPAPPASPIVCGAADWAPGRRITRAEYANVVDDLFGVTANPAWPADATSVGFDNQVEAQPLSFQHVDGMMSTAEDVAALAVADLDALLPCDPASIGEVACAGDLIDELGRRAYRRPLSLEERARLEQVFAESLAETDFTTAVRAVVETILQAPGFHYRFELGEGGAAQDGTVALGGYEIASRLSFFLWASIPDDALLGAAAAGQLASTDGVRAEAERMLADPKARRGLAHFYRQWLRLDRLLATSKLASVYPEFDDALVADLIQGSLEFATYVTLDSSIGDLEELYTANIAAVSARTAPLYGMAAPVESGHALVLTDPAQRAGILTDPGILAAAAKPDQSSPIARGLFVREALLCQSLPSPPEGAIIETPPLDPTLTTRERFAQHSVDPACAGCHSLIDPVGFAFESYDGIGRFRETENGLAIDTSGELVSAADANGPITGALQLADRLVTSEFGQRCFITQLTRYALGHTETEVDACGIGAATAEIGADTSIRDVLLTIVTRPSFLRRPAIDLGTCQ